MLLSLVHTANAQFQDAFDDAQGEFGAIGPLLDIDIVDVRFGRSDLFFEMTFHTQISPPSLNLEDSLVGIFEFDIDQSDATGIPALQNSFSPTFGSLDVGVDFSLNLFSEIDSPGMAQLINDSGVFIADIPVAHTTKSFSGQIPLALLGNDDGLVDFSATIGTFTQPTDAIDAVGTSVAVPEPTSVAVLLAGLTGLLGSRRSKR